MTHARSPRELEAGVGQIDFDWICEKPWLTPPEVEIAVSAHVQAAVEVAYLAGLGEVRIGHKGYNLRWRKMLRAAVHNAMQSAQVRRLTSKSRCMQKRYESVAAIHSNPLPSISLTDGRGILDWCDEIEKRVRKNRRAS